MFFFKIQNKELILAALKYKIIKHFASLFSIVFYCFSFLSKTSQTATLRVRLFGSKKVKIENEEVMEK